MDGLLDFLHDLLPASWFESAQEHFGQGLTDDVVAQSVHEASVFFGMDDPINVHEDWTTGVMTNMSWTENDDILIFSRDQMAEMGITDKEGFDLVMTHEGAHRMLQNMHQQTGFNSHQEELCCDYMAGVRAGLNGMDFTKMEASLADSPESDTHPAGGARVEAIEAGAEFAQEFMEKYHKAPTFSDCLEHFEETNVYAQADVNCGINLSPETTHAYAEGEGEDHSTLKEMFVNDKNWNSSQAKWYQDKAKVEQHAADLAQQKGDYASMREHNRLAVSYQKMADQYAKDAKASTK